MISIAICDDNRLHSSSLVESLEQFEKKEGLSFSMDVYEDPRKFLSHFQPNTYHILLLDIEMPYLSGVELAQAIRSQDPSVLILFLTSHESFMPSVFKVETFDFLVKPVQNEKFYASLQRAIQRVKQQESFVTFTSNHHYHALPSREIFYIEKEGRMSLLHTAKRIYPIRKSSKELAQELPKDFLQIHHSYWINVRYFFKLEKNVLSLRLPQEVEKSFPVSRHFKKRLQEQILERLRNYYVVE